MQKIRCRFNLLRSRYARSPPICVSHLCLFFWSQISAVNAGAIPLLVGLLGSKHSAAVQEQAVKTLANISSHADFKAKIGAAHAVPALVALMGPQSPPAMQEQVVACLMNLAVNAENRAEIKTLMDRRPQGQQQQQQQRSMLMGL